MATIRAPATIKTVAAHAGVSTATVSRVLHNNGYVAPETRERVEAAIRESGYRLDAVAQALRRQRTITLGLILHGILPNPFFAEVAMGVERAAVERGFNVLMFNTEGDPEREREGVESLLSRRVDGVIFTTALSGENVSLVLDAGIPAVEAERRACERAPAVVVDNYAGARKAMNHLLELGHERIAYIGPADSFHERGSVLIDPVRRGRYDGYCDALDEAGIAISDARLVHGTYPLEEGLSWGGVQTGRVYLQTLLEQDPTITAVFAVSDLVAAGALQELYVRSIRVPQDISIVGFDDTFASRLAPALTTVRQPMFEMGVRAGELAIELLDGQATATDSNGSALTEWCETSLVVRESTAPPRNTNPPA